MWSHAYIVLPFFVNIGPNLRQRGIPSRRVFGTLSSNFHGDGDSRSSPNVPLEHKFLPSMTFFPYALTSFCAKYQWIVQPCLSSLRPFQCSSSSETALCLTPQQQQTGRNAIFLPCPLDVPLSGPFRECFRQEGQRVLQKQESRARMVFALARQEASHTSSHCPPSADSHS